MSTKQPDRDLPLVSIGPGGVGHPDSREIHEDPAPVLDDSAPDPITARTVNEAMRRSTPRRDHTQIDYGGVVGADGSIHSDADPGL